MFIFVWMITKPAFCRFLKVVPLLTVLSCQRYAARNEIVNEKDTYFSIKQFAADQIRLLWGQPHSLYKVTYLDGAVDSTLVNFVNLDWSPLLKTFGESDISNKKIIGKYAFAQYEDGLTATRNFIYTAKDPKLFTRTLQIATDPSNNRITSIYIETSKHDFFGGVRQKLLYVPLRIIQVQETQSSKLGKARNLRVEYRFLGEDDQDT